MTNLFDKYTKGANVSLSGSGKTIDASSYLQQAQRQFSKPQENKYNDAVLTNRMQTQLDKQAKKEQIQTEMLNTVKVLKNTDELISNIKNELKKDPNITPEDISKKLKEVYEERNKALAETGNKELALKYATTTSKEISAVKSGIVYDKAFDTIHQFLQTDLSDDKWGRVKKSVVPALYSKLGTDPETKHAILVAVEDIKKLSEADDEYEAHKAFDLKVQQSNMLDSIKQARLDKQTERDNELYYKGLSTTQRIIGSKDFTFSSKEDMYKARDKLFNHLDEFKQLGITKEYLNDYLSKFKYLDQKTGKITKITQQDINNLTKSVDVNVEYKETGANVQLHNTKTDLDIVSKRLPEQFKASPNVSKQIAKIYQRLVPLVDKDITSSNKITENTINKMAKELSGLSTQTLKYLKENNIIDFTKNRHSVRNIKINDPEKLMNILSDTTKYSNLVNTTKQLKTQIKSTFNKAKATLKLDIKTSNLTEDEINKFTELSNGHPKAVYLYTAVNKALSNPNTKLAKKFFNADVLSTSSDKFFSKYFGKDIQQDYEKALAEGNKQALQYYDGIKKNVINSANKIVFEKIRNSLGTKSNVISIKPVTINTSTSNKPHYVKVDMITINKPVSHLLEDLPNVYNNFKTFIYPSTTSHSSTHKAIIKSINNLSSLIKQPGGIEAFGEVLLKHPEVYTDESGFIVSKKSFKTLPTITRELKTILSQNNKKENYNG